MLTDPHLVSHLLSKHGAPAQEIYLYLSEVDDMRTRPRWALSWWRGKTALRGVRQHL